MGVDQGDDHEKRLLVGGSRVQVLQSALLTFLGRSPLLHEAPVVVVEAAALLGNVLVRASVGRVPARKPVFAHIRLRPIFVSQCGLAEVPLALIDDVVARGSHHGGEVLEILWQLDLREITI